LILAVAQSTNSSIDISVETPASSLSSDTFTDIIIGADRRPIPNWDIIAYSTNPFSQLHSWAKRSMDILLASVFCVVTAPLWALTALAIRLDSPGPIFYRQERVGRFGKVFTLLKFRSMVVDAERETGPVWASRNDPRRTRVGRIIRKLGIDEFPQFFNVLRGEMSVVGPRPERSHFVHRFRRDIPGYSDRLCVLPGITGRAQVKHKYDESIDDVRRKLGFDLEYVQNPSLIADLLIIINTALIIVTGKGKF
jgi:exopolysaccharide biosynthesis polyprenyl glycosylphosphotransferase